MTPDNPAAACPFVAAVGADDMEKAYRLVDDQAPPVVDVLVEWARHAAETGELRMGGVALDLEDLAGHREHFAGRE